VRPGPKAGASTATASHTLRSIDDDRALVTAAQGGDRRALDDLLRRHYDRIFAVCRRLAGNEADALDATQEALLAIVRGLGSYDGSARFSTWAYRVATNACLDELRRRNRRPLPGLPEERTPPAPGVDDAIAAKVTIERGLADLPLEFRTAVVLRDLCGLDYAEIGEILGVPPGTVRSRIARGRAALATALTGNPDGEGGRPTPGRSMT
jgi:RNA polymerase sigma-70 factor (ECF subfamily)